MKAWKLRFKRFEGFYIKGQLEKQLVDKIAKVDGTNVLNDWFQACRDKYGDIKQEKLYEQGN